MIENHLSAFAHEYQAEVLDELPSGKNRIVYYPGASELGGKDGLAIEITPRCGDKWIGVFAFGGGGLSAIASTPDPAVLLVVSRGAAYSINAGDPSRWANIRIFPITYLQPIAEKGFIVLADYTRISALGETGLLWTTKDLSWDGISISSIGPDYIEGEGWDPTSRIRPAFRVRLTTGESSGGSSSDMVRAGRKTT